jgi:TP901 family phage tail tape measure protein
MEAVGKKMTRVMTLPILAMGVASTKVFSDFESSMAKITGLVGVAKNQVEAWKAEVLALGPATGQGPEKLAEALFFITSAGIRGAEAMDVLEMAAKAATSGLGEAAVVADLVTSAMNAYGKENLNAAKATDILVATVREGKAEASSLAGAMGMVLPIASEYGVTFDQVGAAFAGMTRTGTNARVAATQLKAILSSMASPALKAENAMEKYGTSSAQFRKDIEEQGLIQALGNLKEAVNGNKVAMAEIFPNIRSLMGVLDLLGKNAEQNREIFHALTDTTGALDDAFESASDTTKFKFAQAVATLKTNMIGLGTSLSSTFLPVLGKVTKMIADATERWDKLSEGQKQHKIRVLALTAAMGPLLRITGRLVKLLATPKGPYGAAIAGALLLTLAITKLVRKHREEKMEYDAVASANQRVSMLYEEQAAKVSYLAAIIEDENISNKGRIAAINELKRIMPGYNGELTDEGTLNQ